MKNFPTFELRLHWDECAWVAYFNTAGGPDCMSQGRSPAAALRRLADQLEIEIMHYGEMSKIPRLPENAVRQ